jgi:hypothetical protein
MLTKMNVYQQIKKVRNPRFNNRVSHYTISKVHNYNALWQKGYIYIYKLQVYEVVTSQWKITSHSILQMVLGSICCLSNGGLITLWFKTIIDDLVVTMGSWDCIEAYCNMCIFLSVKFSAIFEQIWLGEYCSIVYLVKTIWKTFDALLISILGW